MEVRADCDIGRGVDTTPFIKPLTQSLHRDCMHSHCQSCLWRLLYPTDALPCSVRRSDCLVLYCCAECFDADNRVHVSSGECRRLLHLLDDREVGVSQANLCLTLRFVDLLRGFPSPSTEHRILGLLAYGEEREVNSDEARLLLHVLEMEEISEMRFAVDINSADTEEGRVLYPPAFSWFNHSCKPHVVWRFTEFGCESGRKDFLVSPRGGKAEIAEMLTS